MKKVLVVLAVLALAGSVFADPGALIGSPFTFGVVRGLDKDWSDGNIWMSTAVSNACQFGKFDQTSHAQIGSWLTASGQYWCFDCGYGYINSGTTSIILVDQNSPRMRMYNPTSGAYLGSLPNAFPEYSYDDGLGVYAGTGITNTYLYASSYSGNPIKKSDYPCTTWSSFGTTPATPSMGVGYGWGKVFVCTTSTDYKIYCFNADTGTLEDTWSLQGWSYYLMGLAAGRENAVGDDESVFIATFYPSNNIYEVEIGDVAGGGEPRVVPTSLGMIKSAYK
jgi:hypothetical protein